MFATTGQRRAIHAVVASLGLAAAYDKRPTQPDSTGAMVEIPVDDDSGVYLLAYAEDDGVVHYSLTLSALIFTDPEKVLKFTTYAPHADYAFEVRELRTGCRPVAAIDPE